MLLLEAILVAALLLVVGYVAARLQSKSIVLYWSNYAENCNREKQRLMEMQDHGTVLREIQDTLESLDNNTGKVLTLVVNRTAPGADRPLPGGRDQNDPPGFSGHT